MTLVLAYGEVTKNDGYLLGIFKPPLSTSELKDLVHQRAPDWQRDPPDIP